MPEEKGAQEGTEKYIELGKKVYEEKKQTVVGRTSATERDATTSDKFTFWLTQKVIVNPFDIVEVEQVGYSEKESSKTYGLVTNLEHRTDAPSHLANFISSNFGEVTETPNTPRQGATVAHVNVLSNSDDIYMPVPNEKLVYFADAAGIERALGIDTMRIQDRIPAGLIKMSNGASTVACLDKRYVLGPDGAHINISGISGLATKTSYAMFILQSILQRTPDISKVAVVILNVKHGDLLQIDKEPEQALPPDEMEKWEALGLEPKHFGKIGKVKYLLPRGVDTPKTGRPNSFIEPDNYLIYAYDLESTADKLDLLFTNISDPSFTMEALIGDIMVGLSTGDSSLKNVHSWSDLLNGPPLVQIDPKTGARQIVPWRGEHHKTSVGKFLRNLRRLVKTRHTGIFVDSRQTKKEFVLSEEVRKIKGGDIYVVDIARLYDDEQTLVFGDLLRTIYTLKSEDQEGRKEPIPEKIIFFVDELNKYAPSGRQTSPILDQILDIAERGRSLGIVLISAQQFMSVVHDRVTGNAATKILGRSGSTEVFQPDYRFLDDDLKLNITRLEQGELILCHNVYRQPVKVVFPKPAYKQQQF